MNDKPEQGDSRKERPGKKRGGGAKMIPKKTGYQAGQEKNQATDEIKYAKRCSTEFAGDGSCYEGGK